MKRRPRLDGNLGVARIYTMYAVFLHGILCHGRCSGFFYRRAVSICFIKSNPQSPLCLIGGVQMVVESNFVKFSSVGLNGNHGVLVIER